MERLGPWRRLAPALAAAVFLSACANAERDGTGLPAGFDAGLRGASTGSERVLYAFTGGNDGGNAATGLVQDRDGNLYGTTVVGGTATCGTAFELSPAAQSPWKESVLYDFGCYADGKNPHGGVTFDPGGNLDGTTVAGGTGGICASDGCGIAFQLKGTAEKVLHNFAAGKDGFGPGGGVVYDAAGNVFGTTPDGGRYNQGVVYELSRAGGRWRERIVHAFTGGKDGAVGSLGLLLVDASGNL
ncbi:MAG TPA: choice-of-anchor tandem repeat GloVer-containing protein, partial [Candidatus Tumulicola sp.]|nr:choice-of-anchor tandem repeat GloVer-containing protein [Candidatus Tumulicola sp.]